MTDRDFWAWVELDATIPPILGHVIERTDFPPDPPHPAMFFQKYDPVVPEFLPQTAENRAMFSDYNTWSGWNANKSMTVIGLTFDTSADGGTGQTPRFVRLYTSADDFSTWAPDLSLIYYLPATLDIGYFGASARMRFIPNTNHVSFIARDTMTGVTNLYRLDTATMTVAMMYSDLTAYAYSYDAQLIAMQLPGLGVRMFERDLVGVPGAEVSIADIFGFAANSFEFTDNSRYIIAWDGNHHVTCDAFPPYTQQWSYAASMGEGLFGPEPFYIRDVTAHPAHLYLQRAGALSLGFGGPSPRSEILLWDGDIELVITPEGYGGMFGDWSSTGDVWIGCDGGRDPYGGACVILKQGTWDSDSDTRQEAADLRLRPYH